MKIIFDERDLTKLLLYPTLSWSSISCFRDYDKEEWYERYVLGQKGTPSEAMIFGTTVGQSLATDPAFMPEVPRPEVYEQELRARLGKIHLIGHLDGWSRSIKELLEYKTSASHTRWTQKKVDEWNQITMYCLLLWENYRIRPEDLNIKLVAIIGEEEDDSFKIHLTDIFYVFATKRTMRDILLFGAEIKAIHTSMQSFIDAKQSLR